MDRHYIYPHTESKTADRFTFFNDFEKIKKRKKKDTDDLNVTKRKKKRVTYENDEVYEPENHISRAERAENRGNIVVPYRSHGRDDRNRKVYEFSKPIFKKMYHLLWTAKNKCDKIKKLSTWNQVDNRYFWVVYYTAKQIIYNCVDVYDKKYDKIKKFYPQFRKAFEGQDQNEALTKFNNNQYKINEFLNKTIEYWRKNLQVRLQPIANEKNDPYADIAGTISNKDLMRTIKKTYKQYEREDKKKAKEAKKLEKLLAKEAERARKKELRRVIRESVMRERKEQKELNRSILAKQEYEIFRTWIRENPGGKVRDFNKYYKETHKIKHKQLRKIRENKLQHFIDEKKDERAKEVQGMLEDKNSKFFKYQDRIREFFNRKDEASLAQGAQMGTRSRRKKVVPEIVGSEPKRFRKRKHN